MKSFRLLAAIVSPLIAASLRLWDCPVCGDAVLRKHVAAANCPCRFWATRPPSSASFTRARRASPFAIDEDVIVAIVNQTGFSIPGDQRAEAWMFSARGEKMDHLETACSTRDGSVWAELVGGELRPRVGSGFVKTEYFGGFTLRQDGVPPRAIQPGGPDCPKDWLSNGLCRFRLAGGMFQRITPER